jgi:hypothetical protein
MERKFSPHLHLAQSLWQDHLAPSDLAIDATCGNGNDTLFLAGICTVVGMDIQPMALQNTEMLLMRNQKRAILHRLSHAEIDQLPLPHAPKLIVYNLGYLPKGDKSITTMSETTLESVKKGLNLLASGGALSITCYPGHDEGQKEAAMLVEWAAHLDAEKWAVLHHKWLNRPRSPSLIWIVDQKSSC